MYPVSDRFLAALHQSHTAVCTVDVLRHDELVAADLPVLAGEVTDDSSAVVRRSATVQLAPTQELLDMLAVPPPADGGLWPLGNELRLRAGIQYAPGDVELASLGLFRVARPQMAVGADGAQLSLTCYDRGRSVSRARFVRPYNVTAGSNYAEVIRALVLSRLQWLTDDDFRFMETSYQTPSLQLTSDDDPWAEAQKMAESIGGELFFDGDGVCVLQPQPDPLYTPPVAAYSAGPLSRVLTITRDLDDEQAYNGVVVVGENTDLPAPVRAVAWDTDPRSPTYYDPWNPGASAYGPVPTFISSQYVTTQAQAQAAATANLQRVAGIVEAVEFGAVNNPAHTAGDIVTIKDERIDVDATYVLDSIRMGLGYTATMSGKTRRRRAA